MIYGSILFHQNLAGNNISDSATLYYSRDEFKKAAACYEKILKEGKESWILYYNLGNAYYKDGSLGLAILNYEKAKKLNPHEPDILNNLSIAENKVIDKVKMREISLEKEIKEFFIYRLSTSGWAWCSIFSLTLTLSLIFVFLSTSIGSLKKISFWSGILALLTFILSLFFGYTELGEKTSSKRGVIIRNETKVYSKPQLDESARKNLILHEGTKVKVLSTENSWINIQLLNGNEGWISTNDLGIY